MKNVFISIGRLLVNLLLIASSMLLSFGISYYVIPENNNAVTNWINGSIGSLAMFWITIGSAIIWTATMIGSKFLNKNINVKIKNLVIHLSTWSMALIAIVAAITMFVLTNPLENAIVQITTGKKIGLAVLLAVYIVYNLLKTRILALINRRLQARENAIELQAEGRSSIIWNNFLRIFEWLFPEVILLSILCLFISWSVSSFIIVMLVSLTIPFLGNIECDFNIRREAKKRKQEADQKLANMVADKLKED